MGRQHTTDGKDKLGCAYVGQDTKIKAVNLSGAVQRLCPAGGCICRRFATSKYCCASNCRNRKYFQQKVLALVPLRLEVGSTLLFAHYHNDFCPSKCLQQARRQGGMARVLTKTVLEIISRDAASQPTNKSRGNLCALGAVAVMARKFARLKREREHVSTWFQKKLQWS